MDTAHIVVRTLAGQECRLELDPRCTVRDAKDALEAHVEILAIYQRLLRGGRILDDRLRPFREFAAESGGGEIELELVFYAGVSLEDFLSTEQLQLDKQGLMTALQKAVKLEDARLCLDIMCHEELQDYPINVGLSSFVEDGLFEPMEALLNHPGFMGHPGFNRKLLDAVPGAVRKASSRGLPLHLGKLLEFLQVAPADDGTGTALHNAANDQIVQLLFQSARFMNNGITINMQDHRGNTCLHNATTPETCRSILQHPDFRAVNQSNSAGQTALHQVRDLQVCDAILRHKNFTAVNAQDDKGKTALHYVAKLDPLVRRLLQDKKLDVNVRDILGQTALFHVNSVGTCRALLERGADANIVDHNNCSVLHWCTDAEIARAILDQPGFRVLDNIAHRGSARDCSALQVAARDGRQDVMLEIAHTAGLEDSITSVEALLQEGTISEDAERARVQEAIAVLKEAPARATVPEMPARARDFPNSGLTLTNVPVCIVL